MAAGPFVMVADAVAVSEAEARSYEKFQVFSGVSDQIASGKRMVMVEVPLAMGADVLAAEVTAAAEEESEAES